VTPTVAADLDAVSVAEQLDARGYARTERLLSDGQAGELASAFDRDDLYRSRIQMGRYRFGEGDYAYFAYPLPPAVERLRQRLYPGLAAVANEWEERAGRPPRWPSDLAALLAECAREGQRRPTPLVLRYGEGGYNTLHQDLYGAIAFPLQVVVGLSAPGVDYTGGEFVLTEQRPRSQTRATAIEVPLGHGIVFPNNRRPVAGRRGVHHVTHRHGASEVRAGSRVVLGLIFHDAH
jgi:hypothetical protein